MVVSDMDEVEELTGKLEWPDREWLFFVQGVPYIAFPYRYKSPADYRADAREAHENKVAQERYKHGRQCVLSSDRMVRTYTIRIFTDDVHGDETKSRLVPATDQQPEGQT
jgi:hypothetical protein